MDDIEGDLTCTVLLRNVENLLGVHVGPTALLHAQGPHGRTLDPTRHGSPNMKNLGGCCCGHQPEIEVARGTFDDSKVGGGEGEIKGDFAGVIDEHTARRGATRGKRDAKRNTCVGQTQRLVVGVVRIPTTIPARHTGYVLAESTQTIILAAVRNFEGKADFFSREGA